MQQYLFTSERLGFRNWTDDDLPFLTEMNANPKVMEHFPQTMSMDESIAMLKRLQLSCEDKGYTYFAVERLDNQALIGFI